MQCKSKKYKQNYIIIVISPGTITEEDEDRSDLEEDPLYCTGWIRRRLQELEVGTILGTVEDSWGKMWVQLLLRCWFLTVQDSYQEERILDILESGSLADSLKDILESQKAGLLEQKDIQMV